jgi:hypothetical protein
VETEVKKGCDSSMSMQLINGRVGNLIQVCLQSLCSLYNIILTLMNKTRMS